MLRVSCVSRFTNIDPLAFNAKRMSRQARDDVDAEVVISLAYIAARYRRSLFSAEWVGSGRS